MRDEDSGTDQGSRMRGSCASVSRDTAEVEYIKRSSLYQRESALMIYDRHPEIKARWGERHLWARGYYVETVGNINEEVIKRYISEQEESDKFEK